MEQDMQNNRPGNYSWKEIIGDDTAFAADEIPVSHATWEKLYKRLHYTKAKKAVWLWLAAACICAGIVVTAVLSVEKRSAVLPAQTTAVVPAQAGKANLNTVSKQQEAVIRISSGKAAIKNAVACGDNKSVKPHKDVAGEINITSPVKSVVDIALPAASETMPYKPVSIAASSAPSPQKVKLKVVHINELGDNEESKRKTADGDYSVIQFGVKSQPVYSAGASAGKIGFNISTSRTSPSN